MKSNPTQEHFSYFARHIAATLPDGLHERKIVLTCLLAGLPKSHPDRAEVVELLHHLRAHDAAQMKFAIKGDGR